MFRSMLRSFAIRTSEIKPFQFRLFTTSESQVHRRTRREINNVNLFGTICNNVFIQQNGSTKFYLKTFQPNQINYNIHKVEIVNQKILDSVGDMLEVGLPVYVSGKLSSSSFINQYNKTRQSVEIKAHELLLGHNENKLENIDHSSSSSSSSSSSDSDNAEDDKSAASNANASGCYNQNHVKILAHISSKISNHDKFSTFSLATHHTYKNEFNEDDARTHFHGVIVYDDLLQKFAQNNLKKSDYVIVEGRLDSMTTADNFGKKRVSGFIVPTNIIKLSKFQRQSNENLISENE